jgi:RNA polymerase sigma factor (sigma-70 family)
MVASYLANNAAAQHAARFSDEKKLVVAFQSGEPEAGEFIHRFYSPMVRSICTRFLYDPEDVQEAVQETFLRIFRALPRLNGSYQLGAWIARIARNVCLDQIRSRSKPDRHTKQVEDLEESCQSDPGADPQELFLRSQEGRRVYATLAALPPTYRSAILLRDLYGLAYKDIAITLSISNYQVKNFLHRGRESFRRLWYASDTAAFLTLGTRSCMRFAKKCFRIVTFSDTSPRNGMPSPSIPAEVATAASHGARALETGHSILERAAVTMTATFVGIGGAGFASAERSLLPDPVHETSIQQLTDLPADSRSEIGRYDSLRPSEPRGLAQTVSSMRPGDLTLDVFEGEYDTLNVVEDENDAPNIVEDVQQFVLEEISLSLEEGDVCYPPSSGVAEEASETSHRGVDEAEEGNCPGTSLDSVDETSVDETSDGETSDDGRLVAPAGDPGTDQVQGGSGNGQVQGGSGNGQVQGGSGTDQVLGGDGDDDLEGGGDGEDLIEEEQGSLGGRGRGQISGGAENDEVIDDDVTPTEDVDNDTLEAGEGSDLWQDGGGNDGLEAGASDGDLSAGSDDDTLAGDAGENISAG